MNRRACSFVHRMHNRGGDYDGDIIVAYTDRPALLRHIDAAVGKDGLLVRIGSEYIVRPRPADGSRGLNGYSLDAMNAALRISDIAIMPGVQIEIEGVTEVRALIGECMV